MFVTTHKAVKPE